MKTGSTFTIKPGKHGELCAMFNVLNPKLVNCRMRTEVGFSEDVLVARNRPEERLALKQLRKAKAAAEVRAPQT